MTGAKSVDLAFGLRGESIRADYRWALYEALRGVFEWLEDEPLAGIHPLKGLFGMGERAGLSRRTKLVLRLPRGRIEQAGTLAGRRLPLDGELQVGDPMVRELPGYPVLYAGLVCLGTSDELAFHARLSAAVKRAEVKCEPIVGKSREIGAGETRCGGFSVMLHGLAPEDSLRIQASGLGEHRKLGCGIFVPHKSIAPVGG
jgi:CRISPR-associated protein Cas6